MPAVRSEVGLRDSARKTRSMAAQSAHYDKARGRVVMILKNEMELSFAPAAAQGLETATPAQLRHIQISPSGSGIHFPKLNADLSVPGLLKGRLGSRKWMAARFDRNNGRGRTSDNVVAEKASRPGRRQKTKP